MGTYRPGNGNDAGRSEVEALCKTAQYMRDFFAAEQYVTTCLSRYTYFKSRYAGTFADILRDWSPAELAAYELALEELEIEFGHVHSLEMTMGEYRTEALCGISNVLVGSRAWEKVPELQAIEMAADSLTERIKLVEKYIRGVVAARKQYDANIGFLRARLEDMSRLDEGVLIWLRKKDAWWTDRGTTENIRFVEIDEMVRKTMIEDQTTRDLGESISSATNITASLLQYSAMVMSPEFTGNDRMSDDVLDRLLDAIDRIQDIGERVDRTKEPVSKELYDEVFAIQNSCVDVLETFLEE
ncbi:MAG: hypothetical protein HGA31_04320 [Candidatus Moranbacteria bacterium]|nr:hypothetical protein [Candidatus Moranbacteria bacterium]